MKLRSSKGRKKLELTQTSLRGMFQAFPQIVNLYREFTPVPPYDPPCILQSFFVVGQGHQVLEGGHTPLWCELDVGWFSLYMRWRWHRCYIPRRWRSIQCVVDGAETANERTRLVVVGNERGLSELSIITCIPGGVSVFLDGFNRDGRL